MGKKGDFLDTSYKTLPIEKKVGIKSTKNFLELNGQKLASLVSTATKIVFGFTFYPIHIALSLFFLFDFFFFFLRMEAIAVLLMELHVLAEMYILLVKCFLT